ncbi:MAG: iron-containing alcohol dehydrogenase [Bacteroidetes bacterium]|nr:iron-containing alcohol dehydrogenase [Bacteroidota bacterium]
MILQYNFPTTIRFGAGASEELGGYLSKYGLQRPLVATDPTVATLPFFRKMLAALDARGIQPIAFHDIHKNPVKSDVYRGTDAYDEGRCNAIIGIGGGAAMDVARAIALRAHHREDLFAYDDLIGGDVYVTNEVPPFITIPTTAGTGSEVGRSAIIADDATHQKKILFSPKLLARIVFADPLLTMDLPPAVTAATGMDAFTHNIEAYLAKMSHPLCEGIALEGIARIAQSIEKAVAAPDLESRSQMLMASLMGAVAFQKGLGVVHSLAHPLSSLLDTHHGLANAVNLPYGMRFNIPSCEEKFRQIARRLDLTKEDGEGVVQYLFELNQRIGIPTRLQDIGVREEYLDTLAGLAEADFAHPNNPRPVNRNDFRRLYAEAL